MLGIFIVVCLVVILFMGLAIIMLMDTSKGYKEQWQLATKECERYRSLANYREKLLDTKHAIISDLRDTVDEHEELIGKLKGML